MTNNQRRPFRLGLISMPWPLFNRPSLQLGALKAFLQTDCPWIEVKTFHPYLALAKELGTPIYHAISLDNWLSESFYAPILFPGQLRDARQLANTLTKKKEKNPVIDIEAVAASIRRHLDSWLTSNDWQQFDLIGFSVCCNQLLASLAAAKLLKDSHSGIPIVFGGTSCTPGTAQPFQEIAGIDFVINGEGEQPLKNLCEFLSGRKTSLAPPVQLATKETNSPKHDHAGLTQIKDLTRLPMPDFHDYFKEMTALFPDGPFIPILPIEFSRGCWWGKCAFCNLNEQWRGYRFKKHKQLRREIKTLSDTFGSPNFAFADNVLPTKEAHRFFKDMAGADADYHFFAEIRVNQQLDLAVCKQGGLHTVQAGIEALSNSLLKKMGKGTCVLENINAMRQGLELGLEMQGNLIIEFPGSTQNEVDETLINLDFVLPLQPLKPASFFLGHGSPVACNPERYGIDAITSHPNAARLFPRQYLDRMNLLITAYRGDRGRQKKLWGPVRQKIEAWRNFHNQRPQAIQALPPLSYRDAGTYLLIRQELADARVLHHRLRNRSRDIYIYCTTPRSVDTIQTQFPMLKINMLTRFLNELVEKRLMFRDETTCLALAVRRK